MSVKARYNPILFDLDGTLIDSGRDIAVALNRTFSRLGLATLVEEQIMAQIGDGVRGLVRKCLKTAPAIDEDELVKAFRDYYRQNCLIHTVTYPGVKKLLDELGQTEARLGIVTNKPHDFAQIILSGLGLLKYFHTVVGGDQSPAIKPDPAPVQLACRQLGVLADKGIMIGDHSNDVLAGKAARMATCGVLWSFANTKVSQANPDFLCSSVRKLRAKLLD